MNKWVWKNLVKIIPLTFLFINNLLPQVNQQFLIDKFSNFPDIEVDQVGNIHVIWHKWIGMGDFQILYRIYKDDGSPLVDPIQLSDSGTVNPLKMEIRNNKMFCVWLHNATSIKGCIVDLNDYSKKTFTIATSSTYSLHQPQMCFINDSLFVVTFHNSAEVFGKIVNVSGIVGDPFLISDRNPTFQFYAPIILKMPNTENFIVLWTDEHEVFARLFDKNGSPLASSFLVIEDPEITWIQGFHAGMDPNGDFVVIFTFRREYHSFTHWRWFNSNCVPYGKSSVILEDVTMDDPDIYFEENKFALVWSDLKNDVYVNRIFCQRFYGDRTPIENSFTISSGDVCEPRIILKNNKIYTMWTSFVSSEDSNSTASKALLFAAVTDFDNPPLSVSLSNTSDDNQDFILLSNYPNPFNPSTSISYNLPYEGMVTLKVCDILGNEITTLVNEVKPAGEHETEFDASNLSTGVYIYTIQVNSSKGGFLESKKMIVLK